MLQDYGGFTQPPQSRKSKVQQRSMDPHSLEVVDSNGCVRSDWALTLRWRTSGPGKSGAHAPVDGLGGERVAQLVGMDGTDPGSLGHGGA